jgi:transposase
LGWYLQFHKNTSIRQEQIILFLRYLLRHLSNPMVVVWDRLTAHRGRLLQDWLSHCSRVRLEYLPGYAPELNPNEYGWAYLKGSPLANYCPTTEEQLQAKVCTVAKETADQQSLLRSFLHATGLPIILSE